jgi:putative flippase GtrA
MSTETLTTINSVPKKILHGLKLVWNKISSNDYVQTYFYIFIIGLFLFGVQAAGNGFMLPLSGDYNLQSYAFYVDGYTKMHQFLATGEFPMMDWGNILGTNYIGSASFYYLFSPFFWLLLLWPLKFIYQGIFFSLVFKYATGGFFFYILVKDFFHLKARTAFVGGIIYAFSGWVLYFLWFHFSDVIALFPLLFIGVELLLQKKKGWLLATALFLLGITNYFFLFSFVITTVIYALFRWIKLYCKKEIPNKEKFGVLLQGILYFAGGVILAGFVVFPSYISVTESGRATSTNMLPNLMSFFYAKPSRIDGTLVLGKAKSFAEFINKENLQGLFDFFFKWDTNSFNTGQGGYMSANIPFYIISEFFIMNYKCIGNAVFNQSLDNAMGGLFITTPIALLLIPSLFQTFKKNLWFILLVILVIPFVFLLNTFWNTFSTGSFIFLTVLLIILFPVIPIGLFIALNKFPNLKKNKTFKYAVIGASLIALVIIIGYILGSYSALNKLLYTATAIIVGPVSALLILYIPNKINKLDRNDIINVIAIGLIIAMPFIPFTYYLLHAFTQMYGRWELFIVVVALLFILHTFDKIETVNNLVFIVGLLVNIILVFLALSKSQDIGQLKTYESDGSTLTIQAMVYGGEIIFMIIFTAFFIIFRKRKWFKEGLLVAIVGELFISTNLTISNHGYTSYLTLYGGQKKIQEERKVIEQIQEDEDFYRIFNNMATRAYSNLPSTLSYRGVSTFNSIYNKYLDDFINRENISYGGSWSMGYHEKRAYLDRFLGIKYYIVNKEDLNNDGYKEGNFYNGNTSMNPESQPYRINIPFGYKQAFETDTFLVYENEYYINLGFAYDSYIKSSQVGLGGRDPLFFDTIYTKYAILDDALTKDLPEEFTQLEGNYSYIDGTNFFSNSFINFKVTASLRNDCYDGTCNSYNPATDLERPTKVVTSQTDLKNYLATFNTSSMRKRWESQKWFGDELIFETKNDRNNEKVYIAPNATSENPVYVDLTFKMGPNILTSFYNDDKLVAQDALMVHNYQISEWDRKYARGFYVDEPFNRVVLEFLNDTDIKYFSLNDFTIRYSYFDTYKETFEQQSENKLENVVTKTNSFTFDTNYESDKIQVLNIPYDTGWTLKDNNTTVDYFIAQGGFLGFIAKAGPHSYKLDYFTPGLKLGAIFSIAGMITLAGVSLWFNRKKLQEIWAYSHGHLPTSKVRVELNAHLENNPDDTEYVEQVETKIKKNTLYYEIIKYIITGGIATVFDMGVLVIFENILPSGTFYLMLATFFGFIVGLATNYVLSIFWVFNNGKQVEAKNPIKSKLIFLLTSLIGLGLTEILMLIGTNGFKIYYLFVKVVVVLIVLVWNYLSKKIWLFNDKKPKEVLSNETIQDEIIEESTFEDTKIEEEVVEDTEVKEEEKE